MTTKNSFYAFAALAALTLAGCNNDEDFVRQDDLKDTPITVHAAVAELTSRAGHDDSNLPTQFYLTINQDGEKYDYTNVLMTKASDGNTYSAPEGTMLLWKDGNHEAVAVNAYTTDGTTFAVQTDQSSKVKVEESDLLGAVSDNSGDVSINGSTISIWFRHLLCKLDVTFTWGTEFDGMTKKITKVTYSHFGTDVTLDRATGRVTQGTATADLIPYLTTTNDGVTYNSEAIFAPNVSSPEIIIETTINNVARKYKATVTAPSGGFVSGSRYTMNVQIGADAVTTGNIQGTAWNSGTGDTLKTE